MKLTITDKQLNLLNIILNNDCAYLENCTEEEFKNYLNLKFKFMRNSHENH